MRDESAVKFFFPIFISDIGGRGSDHSISHSYPAYFYSLL